MATTKGSKALKSDLTSWYTSFNDFIGKYGGSIAKVTVPTTDKIQATDINTLNDKLTEFTNDEYLKTQPTFWTPSPVTVGTQITASGIENITSAITNMAKVVCRNSYPCNHGTSSCYNGYCRDGYNYNSTDCQKGRCSNGYCNNGYNSDIYNYQGAKGVMCQHGSCTANGDCNNGTCSNGYEACYHGECNANGSCTANGTSTCKNGYTINILCSKKS